MILGGFVQISTERFIELENREKSFFVANKKILELIAENEMLQERVCDFVRMVNIADQGRDVYFTVFPTNPKKG